MQIECWQPRKPADQISQTKVAVARCRLSRTKQDAAGISQCVVQAKQAQFPVCVAAHRVNIVETDKLAASKAIENGGAHVDKFAHGKILRVIPGAFANSLKKMCFACCSRSPNPAARTFAGRNDVLEECNQCLVSRRQETLENRVILELQWQGKLTQGSESD